MEIYLIRHTTPAVAKGTCYGQTDLELTDSLEEEAAIIRRHLPLEFDSVHSSPLLRCARLAGMLFPNHPVQLHRDLMEIHCGHWEMKNWDELPREELDPWMQDFVQVRIPGGESYLDLYERVNRCYRRIRDGGGGGPDAGLRDGDRGAGPELGIRDGAEGEYPGEAGVAAGRMRDGAGVAVDGGKSGADVGGEGGRAVQEGAIAIITHGGPIRSILSEMTDTPLIDSFKAFSLHYGCVVRLSEGGGVWRYELLSNPAPAEKEQHKPKNG